MPCAVQSFVKDVEDLGLHDSTTDRCRVSAKTGLPDDIKMPAWLKAYNKVAHFSEADMGLSMRVSRMGEQSIAVSLLGVSCNAPITRH